MKIDIEPELLESMYWGNELGVQEIADNFECCYHTIYRLMKEHKIERRGGGHPGRSSTLDNYQDRYILRALIRYENHKMMRG